MNDVYNAIIILILILIAGIIGLKRATRCDKCGGKLNFDGYNKYVCDDCGKIYR